jgi:hypothetical protein
MNLRAYQPLLLSIIALFLFCNGLLMAQTTDSTQTPRFLRGQITATNNGVSLIPSFSLGRPAALFDLSIGKGRLSFDPMLRFGLDGKPWAFILWWRYQLVKNQKFTLGVGAHPSFVFRDVSVLNNGLPRDYLTTQRYFAWEVSPTYFVNKNINVGAYYLGSHGLTKDIVQYTTFLAVRSGITLPLSNKCTLGLIPQVYYLKMDDKDGKYVNATANLYHKKTPISLNAVVSQAIETEIAGKQFLWSLVYNLNFQYSKIR